MRMIKLSLLSLAVASSTLSHAVVAEEALSNLFTQGKPLLDVRYRYEHVDQDNALNNANAQTIRTRVGFQSGKWYGLSALIEADNVSRIGDASYNSFRNGQRQQGQFDHAHSGLPDRPKMQKKRHGPLSR